MEDGSLKRQGERVGEADGLKGDGGQQAGVGGEDIRTQKGGSG